MFTPYGEFIRTRHADPHARHQADGRKLLLAALCRPILNAFPHFCSVREILEATAAGSLTPAQAEKAIHRLNRRRTLPLNG